MNDRRVHLRVLENQKISWHTAEGNAQGEGLIKNLSSSGVLLETNSNFKPQIGTVISFESSSLDSFPKTGRVVWYRQKKFDKNKFLCGVQFNETSEEVLLKLQQRVQDGTLRKTKMRKINKTINILLIVLIIVLVGVCVTLLRMIYENLYASNKKITQAFHAQATLTKNYQDKYEETEFKLNKTEYNLENAHHELGRSRRLNMKNRVMIKSLHEELEVTKTVLKDTETMLNQVKEEKSKLENNLDMTKKESAALKQELEGTIKNLEDKNSRLKDDMGQLQDKINFYEGNIASSEEGDILISIYRKRMKLVKGKIRDFRREARKVKFAAEEERDKIRSLLGNNGYFMRNGERVVVDYKKYETPELEQKKEAIEPNKEKIKVDVNIVP